MNYSIYKHLKINRFCASAKRFQRAFSLIELIVIVGLIGVLAVWGSKHGVKSKN